MELDTYKGYLIELLAVMEFTNYLLFFYGIDHLNDKKLWLVLSLSVESLINRS